MSFTAQDLSETARRGVELCRDGKWERGFRELCQVANADRQGEKLPSVFYSYLGYGLARYEKRFTDGEKLCKKAIDIEFYQPENYANLARLYSLRGMRKEAVEAVRKGLQVDSTHEELRSMLTELGVRRKPVLSFLSRDHPLNRMLGRMRHDLTRSGRSKKSTRQDLA
jgi:tetratricopeptide (TPR) repeat protein